VKHAHYQDVPLFRKFRHLYNQLIINHIEIYVFNTPL